MTVPSSPLPQLELEGYRATTFDYDPPPPSADDESSREGDEKKALLMPGKHEWIEVFRKSTHEFKRRAAADPRVPDASRLAEQFAAGTSVNPLTRVHSLTQRKRRFTHAYAWRMRSDRTSVGGEKEEMRKKG